VHFYEKPNTLNELLNKHESPASQYLEPNFSTLEYYSQLSHK